MTTRLIPLVALLFLAGCQTLPGKQEILVESRVEETKDLAAIPKALAAAEGRKVLLVLDIDDTLLTSVPFFGSDSWYEWQDTLPADDWARVPCRFDVIGLNFEAGTQKLTQDDAPGIVAGATVDRILLTSRGANYRAGTIRELEKAGYTLPQPLGEPTHGTMWRWTDERHPDKRTYPLSYDRGVFMTTGANKGRVLLHLLDERGLQYDHVILADDGRRNIDNMQAALADRGIGYHGLWYTRIDKTVTPEKAAEGRHAWTAWRALLQSVYPDRWARLEKNECFN